MMLVSFKNIHIWPKIFSCGQKMARMHAYIWAYIFWANWAGSSETIFYRLVKINLSYNAYFSFLKSCATFGGKMGVATTRVPNGLEPPNPTKKGQPLSRNHVFEIFRGDPPPF